MNILQNLAQGLRGAAGVLSPAVQKQTFEQDQRQQELAQQEMIRRRNLAAQQIIKGAEMGAIEPEAAKAQLQQLGFGEIPVGPSAETQTRQTAATRERELRRRLATATTPEERRAIAMEFASPDRIIQSTMEKPVSIGRGGALVPDGQGGWTRIEGSAEERRPLTNNRFPIGGGRVQPHISFDNGKTWEPVPGSQPIDAKAISGSTTVNIGSMTPTKTTQNKIDDGVLDTTQRVMQLNQISRNFKPEWLEIGTRLNMEAANWMDKLGGRLSTDDTEKLTRYSEFRRNAIDNLNQYIKSITGAAMTEAEAARILRGMPNPGQGLFDGDGPTAFKAKLDGVIRNAKLAEARFTYMKRNNNMSLTDGSGNPVIPLERMPEIMNRRGTQIEQALKKSNPNVGDSEIKRAVRNQLAQEFGLVP